MCLNFHSFSYFFTLSTSLGSFENSPSIFFWYDDIDFYDVHEVSFIYHHHHVILPVWISLTLSHHSSLSSITLGRSSILHPVSVQSFCRWVLAGCPTLACPCEGVHGRTLLMSSSLLLQQCPLCLVCLIWMVFEMGGRWPCSCCFVRCGLQDLFNTAFSPYT